MGGDFDGTEFVMEGGFVVRGYPGSGDSDNDNFISKCAVRNFVIEYINARLLANAVFFRAIVNQHAIRTVGGNDQVSEA